MRLIFSIVILLAFTPHGIEKKNSKSVLEIEMSNIMTGKTAKYAVCGDKIVVYKTNARDKFRLISSTKLSEEKANNIFQAVLQFADSFTENETIKSDSAMLDGFSWSLMITNDNMGFKKQKYEIYNCYHGQLDNIIQLVNAEIKENRRLILPTNTFFNKD